MDFATALIETANGTLRGCQDGEACSFKGIPYAADTSGPNRFRAPQPVRSWVGIREALNYGNRCPQAEETIGRFPVLSWYAQHGVFSEDCCTLNVFVSSLHPARRRPVILYIHGGGYSSGSCNGPALDGSRLAAFGEVVVVTVNHRVNTFGYTCLSHLDSEEFGDAANAGQLDLVAALKWVQRNIAAFGGDPGNVTLLGQSGGGNKIMVLLTMPSARGLFQRAINMGGATGLRLVEPEHTQPHVAALLRALGIRAGELRKLQDVPVEVLQKARNAAIDAARSDGAQPVVDGQHVLASPFTRAGLALHASVPLIIGTTDTEATLFLASDMRNFQVDEAGLRARIQAQFHLDATQTDTLIAAYRLDEAGRGPADVLCHLASDVLARGPLLGAAEAKANSGGARVYLYNFAWKIPAEGGIWRSPHTVDIPFAFGTLDAAAAMVGDDVAAARETSRNLMSAFVAFASCGDPNNSLMPAWRPYDTADRATMVIDEHCRLVNDFRGAGRMASQPLLSALQPTALRRGALFHQPS